MKRSQKITHKQDLENAVQILLPRPPRITNQGQPRGKSCLFTPWDPEIDRWVNEGGWVGEFLVRQRRSFGLR